MRVWFRVGFVSLSSNLQKETAVASFKWNKKLLVIFSPFWSCDPRPGSFRRGRWKQSERERKMRRKKRKRQKKMEARPWERERHERDVMKEKRGYTTRRLRRGCHRLGLLEYGCWDNKAGIISQSPINSGQVTSCPSVREHPAPRGTTSPNLTLFEMCILTDICKPGRTAKALHYNALAHFSVIAAAVISSLTESRVQGLRIYEGFKNVGNWHV